MVAKLFCIKVRQEFEVLRAHHFYLYCNGLLCFLSPFTHKLSFHTFSFLQFYVGDTRSFVLYNLQ